MWPAAAKANQSALFAAGMAKLASVRWETMASSCIVEEESACESGTHRACCCQDQNPVEAIPNQSQPCEGARIFINMRLLRPMPMRVKQRRTEPPAEELKAAYDSMKQGGSARQGGVSSDRTSRISLRSSDS